MAIVENTRSRISPSARATYRPAISRSALADGSILWQLSGIENVVDYHPTENRRVFVARASDSPPRKQARSRQVIRLRLTYFPRAAYKRAYFAAVRIVVFLRASLPTNPTYATAFGNTTAGGGITMTADATECFSITVSTRKDLSCSRISSIPSSRNGAFNAFPPLVRHRISQYEVEIWQITGLNFARCWPSD